MTATPGLPVALTMIVMAGLLTGAGGSLVLRRLPEPVPPADADDLTRAEYLTKISYRSVATMPFGMITGLAAAAGIAVVVFTRPAAYWGVWLAFGTIAVLLAAIDARTTWLPAPVMVLGWIVTAVAVILCLLLDTRLVPMAITIGSSIAIAGGGYLVLMRLTGGRSTALGDVQLMLLVGAVAGTMGWAGLYWSLLFGSVVGALIGVGRLIAGRRGPFPYAPALVSGPYAAAVLLSVLP